MTKNRNQSNRAAQSLANNKSTDTVEKPTNAAQAEKNTEMTNKQSSDNHPAAENKQTNTTQATKKNNVEAKESATNNAQVKMLTTETPKTAQQTEQNSKEKPAAKVAATTTTKAATKPANPKTENSHKQVTPKAESKTGPKKSEPVNPPKNNKASEEKKSGKGLALLALLLGLAGTGLGAYSYNELRTLKSTTASTTDYSGKITAIEKQLQELSSASNDDGQKQISDLISQIKTLKTSEAGFGERIAQVEQAQIGIEKNTSSTLDKQLSTISTLVSDAQKEIKNIKLGQQGLAKNISELSAGSNSVSESGMSTQEVGYLLRMADFKLASERDTNGAAGLLQMAADRLVAANDDKNTVLIDAIRATTIQLQGVKLVDENTLFIQLGKIARDIPLLVVKSNATATKEANVDAKDKSETEEPASAFDKALAVIASGVKYTPNDPSKIDISAETVLIEKILMQADIKTAEFAVRTHNKTLLSESFRSIRDKLNKNFADDKTSQTIKSSMTDIEQSELAVALPSLSGLIKQFEQTQ